MSLLEFSERPRVNEPRVVYNYPSTHKWTYPSPNGSLLPVIEEKRNVNFSSQPRDSIISEENIFQANAPGKNEENDVMLLEYCVWRWKWSLCFLLFLPYWIAAVYWDYRSAENKRNDPDQKHYSAWAVNTVFATLVVGLLSNLCRRRFCMDLDSFGQDSQGTVWRPDLWLLQNVSDLSERTQCIIVLIAVGFWIFWILIECGPDFEKWQCLLGIGFFVLLSAAISFNPTRINYRPVIWGLFLQWIFGFLVLRTWLGDPLFRMQNVWITSFINHANLGNQMVSEDDIFSYEDFAFRVIPTVIFFSATVSVLYYLGILQKVIGGVSWFMTLTLGTSAAESFASFANIFIGQTEAAILIAPFLKTMTYSEINTVMTSGFATISGSALMLYATYGIESRYLLASGVMSTPAAIAIAKIVCPETEEIAAAPEQGEAGDKSRSLLDAIIKGALRTIMIVANILVLLIAFLGAINFANGCIGYLGERVGLVEDSKISFIKLCGWILYPLCWLMGVPGEDCFIVGELLGYKIFASELVAYKEMICSYQDEGIGERAVYIATYALSGFSSLAAIGIQIGTLLHLAPEKNQEVISIAFRAMISGNLACFMTACVAGILTREVPVQDTMALNCSE